MTKLFTNSEEHLPCSIGGCIKLPSDGMIALAFAIPSLSDFVCLTGESVKALANRLSVYQYRTHLRLGIPH